ncbi:MAG TPA: sensor histidine kinase [Nitrososphaera sp.]|nr:sensor histidine kinase [Nitrososphaera sp.]
MNKGSSSIVIASIVVFISIILALFVYTYSTATSEQILKAAAEDVRSNAIIKANDLSVGLSTKLSDVIGNMQIITNSEGVLDGDIERTKRLLFGAQQTTKDLTAWYGSYDRDGRLTWTTLANDDPDTYLKFIGTDLSYREYFIQAKANGRPYIDSFVQAIDGSFRMHIAYPFYDNEDQFTGLIGAGIDFSPLQKMLVELFPSDFEKSVMLVDKNGVIITSRFAELEGKNIMNVSSNRGLADVNSENEASAVSSFIIESMNGGGDVFPKALDVYDRSYGRAVTIVSSPIIANDQRAMTLFVIAPHNLSSTVLGLLNQQQLVSILMIAVIAAVAVGFVIILYLWNRRLGYSVAARTAELRQANEKLKVHDNLQKEFINIAAHELRTPIQPIVGLCEIIQDMPRKDNSSKIEISEDDLQLLKRNADRLERLSYRILEASRLDSQSLKLDLERVDLNQKIRNVISDVQPLVLRRRHLKIISNSPADATIFVKADRVRLFQVLSNLVRNSLKFTKEGGTITISLEEKDGQAVIRVKDDGEGIDDEIFPKLFGRFVSKSQQGTGLGLYVSKGIIEAHGGKIWAENNSDGKGATFTIVLPNAKRAPFDIQQERRSEDQ